MSNIKLKRTVRSGLRQAQNVGGGGGGNIFWKKNISKVDFLPFMKTDRFFPRSS